MNESSTVTMGDDDNSEYNKFSNEHTFKANVWLNNNEELYYAFNSLLFRYDGDILENEILNLLEEAVTKNIITDKINLWMVDVKQIIIMNGGFLDEKDN